MEKKAIAPEIAKDTRPQVGVVTAATTKLAAAVTKASLRVA
ncbi:hypothetical protein [Nostoc sp.]